MLVIFTHNTLLLSVLKFVQSPEKLAVSSKTIQFIYSVAQRFQPWVTYSKQNVDIYSLEDTYKNVYSNFLHNYLRLKTTPCPPVEWITNKWWYSDVMKCCTAMRHTQ